MQDEVLGTRRRELEGIGTCQLPVDGEFARTVVNRFQGNGNHSALRSFDPEADVSIGITCQVELLVLPAGSQCGCSQHSKKSYFSNIFHSSVFFG